jgi:O-antigen/teichoic acid export membrane protein
MKNNSFEKTGVLIFAVSMLSSGLSYLFQILCGRLLNTSEYGQINTLFSMISILAVIGSALGLSIAKYIAEAKTDYGGEIKTILKQAIYISPVFITVTIIMFHFFTNSNLYISIITAIATYFAAFASIFYGVLQGKKKFYKVNVFNMISPLCKLVIGISLLVIGLSYHSVIYTLIVGSIITILYGFVNSKKLINFNSQPNKNNINEIYKYFIFTFISTICLTIFNNFDILLIKSYFNNEITGMYSSAALFGKIILYIPTAFITMMVPIVAESKSNKESFNTLKKTFIMSFSLSSIACLCLFAFKKLIIKILMGDKYLPSAEFVLPTCIMMLALVCVTIFVNYSIIENDKFFAISSCFATIISSVILTFIFNKTVAQTIYTLSILYFILSIILIIRIFQKQKEK